MQKLWEVTCNGKTLPELKKALEGALRELEGGSVTRSSVQVSAPSLDEEYVDESEISALATVHPISQAPISTQAGHVNASLSELDSEGIPWSATVHASSKEKVANGTWRARRGVDKTLLANYKLQFRSAVQQPQPVQQSPAPINNNFNQPHAHQPVQQQVVHTPPVQTAPAMPSMNNNFGHTLQSFQQNFPVVLSHLINVGKVNEDYIATLRNHFQVDEIWKITNDQKAMLFNSFVEWGYIQQVG